MNNRVFITGANRGIGLEIARQYVLRGDHVFASCRHPEKAKALKELLSQYPEQVQVLALDVTDMESIAAAVTDVAREVEGIEVLINNAAINMGGETITHFRPEDAIQIFNTNAVGQMLVTQGFLKFLKKGRSPKIVNISSEAGSITRMTRFRGYYYYASKAALNMFTRSLALDPETSGIIVIAVHPGWVRTDMGGSNARLSPKESVEGILQLTDRLTEKDNGQFYTWTGENYPW